MRTLLETLNKTLLEGQDVVLCTIVAGSGSTPREAGARMVVGKSGRIAGTIGGGAVEYRAEQLAIDALRNRQSYVKGFRLTRNEVEDLGMVCGGDVDVHFQYISQADEKAKELLRQIIPLFARDEDAWIMTDLTDDSRWTMGAYSQSTGVLGLDVSEAELLRALPEKPRQINLGNKRLYIEPLVQSGRVIIFGGGHISFELVPLIAHLGFRPVVFDDRKDYAAQDRFPQATVVLGDFAHIADYITLRPQDYVVIMTRGHAYDYEVLRQVLEDVEIRYVGMIGSRSKVAKTKADLMGDGIPESRLDKVYAPIGVNIKAETPAEIAVSIAGELILVRADTRRP
ncbi:MAG: XdhC family protein [Bacillota bacterium]|jgi:xanthine dehydrogenase accessory factor